MMCLTRRAGGGQCGGGGGGGEVFTIYHPIACNL